MMDTEEGICYGELCELCKTDELQTCSPERNNTLYVNFLKSMYMVIWCSIDVLLLEDFSCQFHFKGNWFTAEGLRNNTYW